MITGNIISFAKYKTKKSNEQLRTNIEQHEFAIMDLIEVVSNIHEMIEILFSNINQKPCGC